ncbi:serine hydrolase [Heliobacterium mobile]|uniref:serine hydrolase n=1 Tax=Heliobacterium mobile TaxID=28064 RepID=UPI001478BF83|nr:serine hydrolase [Heliobacterium mobile]
MKEAPFTRLVRSKIFVIPVILSVATSIFPIQFATAASVSAQTQVVQSSPYQQILDDVVTKGSPGAMMLVQKHGEKPVVTVSGLADTSSNDSMDAMMQFRVGSVTKTFVATTVLQLEQEGKLNIEDSVEKYLPGLIPDGQNVTLHQLLNHTSGLNDYATDPQFLGMLALDMKRDWKPQELVAFATQKTSLPKGQFYYSNTNYIILGLIVEKVDGMPLDTSIKNRIIKPLKLKKTYLATEENLEGTYAHGYMDINMDGQVEDITSISPSSAWAAGALVSNMGDLATWAKALGTGKLLNDIERKKMMTYVDASSILGTGVQYGLGIGCYKSTPIGKLLGHSGNVPGYLTEIAYSPDKDLSIVLMINTNRNDLIKEAEGKLLAQLAIPTVEELKAKPTSISLSAGATKKLKVTAKLSNHSSSDVTSTSTYVSSDPEVVTVDQNGLITVSSDAKRGKTAKITITYGGRTCKIGVRVK